METLSALLAAIPQPDVAGMARAQQHIDGLLKPPGSLGRLETLAVQLAGLPGLQGQLALAEKAIVVMCADHGVWHEGVTPSPQGVTAIHAGNMVRGNTGVGELGMANTTPAAATISVLTGSDPDAVVGCGANLPLAQRGHKVAVVRQAIAHNQPNPADGLDVLAKVGGYDLVGMTGVILGAASCGLPVVLDGFLSYASALAACRMAPSAHPYLIPSHLSAEKGAQIALDALGLRPYLDMDMRLGEGSGAALAMHLLDAASVMYNQMGTLAQSNIVLPDSAPSS